jgi:hypothetical protein
MTSRKKLVSVLNNSKADVMNTYRGTDLLLQAFLTSAHTQLQPHHVPNNDN